MNPWLVPITSLRRQTGSRREEHRYGRVGELRVADSIVPGDAEVEAEAVLDAIDGGIEVSATVIAPWQGECRRCLEVVTGRLHCDVREVYRPRDPAEAEADEETYPLHGEMLDLTPLVRDALLLELPIAPLCRPDCRGLCPVCGADRNQGDCGCVTSTSDPRWAALDILKPRAGAEGDPSA